MLRSLYALLALFLSFNSFGQSFNSRWNTTELGTSNDDQITIPTNPGFTYDYTVNWGDGTTDNNVTGDITHSYAAEGLYTISISGVFPSIYFNDGGDRGKIIEILSWGTIQWQTMENAFYGCENLNFDAIDAPDLSLVTSLKNMFKECTSFNGIMNNWNVSTITDISGIFTNAEIFNRPLDNWNTINVTDMSEVFKNCYAFNEPLDNWNTASVTNMREMFYATVPFNQNINNWDVSQVTDMSGMFVACRRFNQPLNLWNVANVTDMNLMFFRTDDFEQDLSTWQVGNVTDMFRMFHESAINFPIVGWDVSNVTNMGQMFSDTPNFNQPLNGWNVSGVTNMSDMFESARAFNQPLDLWNVSNVTDMSGMFSASVFNQPLNNWDVSSVTNMEEMFYNNAVFNQPLNNWNVSSVLDMQAMFRNADAFNQPIENWNVTSVTSMQDMFRQNDSFNQSLNGWNVSSVTTIASMFGAATTFNQPLNNWNISSITNMGSVFSGATSFNQDLSGWIVENVTTMGNMLNNSGLSQENYDTILITWATQNVNDNVNLGATNLTYCDGLSARQSLIDDHNWNITGDSVNCSFVLCTEITSPNNGDNNVPANSDIRWNPAPNATGYRITLEVERNGIRDFVTFNGNIANNLDVGNVVGLDFTNEFNANDIVFFSVTPYNTDGPATGCPEISFTVVESWVNSPDAFKITIDTRNLDNSSSAANQYWLETLNGLTYDFSVDWGDGQYNNNVDDDIIHTYLNQGIYTIAIIGDFPSYYHGSSNRDNLKLLSIDQWGTQVWESMRQTFYFCENMVYNATDIPNLSLVTDMRSMFRRTYLFDADINNWNVSNVTDMSSMFYQASIFNSPLDNWDVGNVISMGTMFSSATIFDQPIGNWNVASVTNMSNMFNSADTFNQNLNSWNVSNVTSMSGMFQRAEFFDQPLNNWNVENVVNMGSMFNGAENFNQNIDNWNVSKVTSMDSMFSGADAFNEPLNSWDVSSVISMGAMFSSTDDFNQPLNNWNVGNVINMSTMFSGATSFNQNINTWNVTNVTNMRYTFSYATVFNQPLNSWNVNSVVNMSGTFRGAQSFNQPLDNWNVSAVANMTQMFEDAILFNQPINTWNVSSVTLMESMFEDAEVFNQSLDNWNISVVTNFEAMFKNALLFNTPLNTWNTGEALNMAEMFSGAAAFNQNIDTWNVSFVTTMEEMFKEATSFNQPLNSWNVASVNTMEGMFWDATAFNTNIDAWNVRAVNTMDNMFRNTTAFNQSLNNWRISGVTTMDSMFEDATAYNQTMDNWNLGNVSMRSMLEGATTFNQYLGDWNISGVTDMEDMLDNTALIRENYDNTIIAWSEQTPMNGIDLGAEGLPYCDALEERQSMIDNFNWTFTDDVLDCPIPECTALISPLNGAVDVPINTNLNWEPALFARNYELTITIQPANTIITETVNTTSYEFAAGVLTAGDTVSVVIVPTNDEGPAVGCPTETFTISANPATVPDCTQLSSPLANETEIAVDTDIVWNPVANADGYFLNIGTTSGGTDILNLEDAGNTTNFELPTELPEDTEIFVTIIPYNEEGNATGCSEESFTTELIPVAPDCTVLNNPINGATNVLIDTSINWNPVDGATGYLVVVGITQGGIEIANNVDVNNTTSYTFPANLQENRTHYVTIIPYNNVGDAIGCAEENFRTGNSTLNDPPSCTILSAPLNGATNVSLDTDISWNAIPNTDGYRLSVGTTSGGNNILDNFDVGNVLTYDLPANLPENSAIFVTVIPYNSFGDASGCNDESFTTELTATVPDCTALTSPLNGASGISVSTDLTWNGVADADGYRITIGTTTGGNDILNNFDLGNVLTYNPPANFAENTEIFVSIIPYNAIGDASGCIEESFTTETAATVPICTILSSPLNSASDVSISTDLSWNASADADGYLLTVGTAIGGNDILDNFDVGNILTYDLPTDLPENTEIFVTIIPYNSVGDATGCAEERFTTETVATVPDCTSLSSPLAGATDVSISTDLNWNLVSNADGYRLTVGTISSGNDILDNFDVGNVLNYDLPTDLIENTEIFVTIIPYNSVGDAVGCSEESFTTEIAQPGCSNLITPIFDAINVPVDTDLTWNAAANAVRYTIGIGTATGLDDILTTTDVGNNTTFNPPINLPENTRIFVTIFSYNAVDESIVCGDDQFTTGMANLELPNCTSLSSALINATTVSVSSDLTWDAVSNADGYRLTIGTTTNGNDILDNLDVGNVLTYDLPTDLPFEQQIFVTITPYNTFGDAIGCAEQSFTTVTEPMTPACTNLLTPLNLDIDVPVNVILSWNASADADGYRLTVGTASGLGDVINNQDIGNVTSFNLPDDLPENTEIFVFVLPYNAVGEGDFCEEESFITETLAPDTPPCTTITTPENSSTDVPVATGISWNAIGDIDGYIISIGTTEGGTDILDNFDAGLTTSYDLLEDLPFEQEIFVSVLPYNETGNAQSCEVHSFITVPEPEVESLYGFSPDGDGINEFWVIEGIEQYPDNTVVIYNRWGDMVFQINGYDNNSNVFRGEANQLTGFGAGQLPEGTYFFQLILPEDNNLKQTKGFLVLKR